MGALNEHYYNLWLSVKSVSSVCRFSFLLCSYSFSIASIHIRVIESAQDTYAGVILTWKLQQ